VSDIRIYVEGGGDSNDLKTKCREGVRKLLEKRNCSEDNHLRRDLSYRFPIAPTDTEKRKSV